MKILHTVQLYHPKVGGSEEVVKQISERLAERGHDVTVATAYEQTRGSSTINGVHVQSFHLSGNAVRGYQGDVASYQRYLATSDFDVIMNYAAQIWSTDLALPQLGALKGVKVIVPCGYSALHDPLYADYFHQLPNYLKQYDQAIYLSPFYQDKRFADQHRLKNSLVIPNGADEREFNRPPLNFRKRYGITTKYVLLCVANHYNLKGHAALLEAFDRLGRKDTTLVVIGNPVVGGRQKWRVECYRHCRLAALRNRRIKMLTHVPREWVVSAYQEADLFVFSSLVECSPLVIFEAMAAGLPFISTDVGDVKERQAYGALVEDTAVMATEINDWLNNSGRRAKIGAAAQAEWKAHYSWDKITDRYEQLYQQLLGSKRS